MNSINARTWKIIGISFLALFFTFCIARCGMESAGYQQGGYAQPAIVSQAPIVQAAPTTIVQPVAVGGGYGGDGFFTGLLAGHLMSGGFNRGGSHTVEHVYHPAPQAATPVAPAQRAAPPAYRPTPSYTSNSRGITTVNRSTSTSRSISVGRRR